jgi:hypothetical protein
MEQVEQGDLGKVREHFDWVATHDRRARNIQSGFRAQMLALHRHHIPEGATVLEWGTGRGDLLAGLKPRRGLGMDFSRRMVERARVLHEDEGCEFRVGDVHRDPVDEKFEYIVFSYLTGYLRDIAEGFRNALLSATPSTRLHVTSLNTAWLLILALAQDLRMVTRQPPSNWLSRQDIVNLLEVTGWEVIHWKTEQIFPFQIPGVSALLNRYLVRLPLFRHLGLTLHLIARPRCEAPVTGQVSCTLVVPARNEAGNIAQILQRTPQLGSCTELILVEGNSTDDTWATIQREVAAYRGPHQVRALRQEGKGKWDAVRKGFAEARGEVIGILDADLTVPPEDLPKFYRALVDGAAEFANGSRLVYPMEAEAMRFLNLLGNHFFAGALSFVLSQPIKDSLCGTKMLFRRDYVRAMRRIEEFGDFDPFGDFSLLFGASLLDLRIRDIPVRYRERKYGTTNIRRFRHGATLLRMTLFGLRRIRFFPLRTDRR